jgi:hypothetical protein
VARNDKTRQRASQRRAVRQRKKPHLTRGLLPAGSRALIPYTADWPLHECLISRDWESGDSLVQILVVRQSPTGSVAAGMFLVDLGCLGVKNAFARLFHSFSEFEMLRRNLMSSEPIVPADLNLAAKIIREAVAYARQLGFSPDPDYREASLVLGDADPDASKAVIPVGRDGKPFFVAGPHDNARKIIAQLTRAVGPGNFDYVVPIDVSSR